MASPGELISVVASVLGLPEPSVLVAYRNLRVAGLVTRGGRGTSAAKMTARDAANLLLSVTGTTVVKDSLRPIQRHARMMSNDGKWRLEDFPIPELMALGDDHSFADALQALIESAISGSMANAFNQANGSEVDLIDSLDQPAEITVTMSEPQPFSTIEFMRIDRYEDDVELTLVESKKYGKSKRVGPGNLSFDPPLDIATHADMTHRHTFTQKTLAVVGNLLKDPPPFS